MVEFWKQKSLDEMSDVEWESLCDGCGRCCLQKLEDEETGEIVFTRLGCRLLDTETCRCKDYEDRQQQVPDCTMVRPLTAEKCSWLPDSCAYKLLATGQELAPWHPLVSGRRESVVEAGISVLPFVISETEVDEENFPEFVIHFDQGET